MRKFIASIVYTHLWIAICATAMVLQTTYLLTDSWVPSPLAWLTLGSTLSLYALHRLVGLQKLKDIKATLNPRYVIINRDQRIVLYFGIIGSLITGIFFFQLRLETQLWLMMPVAISVAYVIPFLSGKKRLRDIGLLKIFLIAVAYAMVSVQLVYIESAIPLNRQSWILFLEKALFIFAITIPFDIRDLKVDQVSGVKTIPKILGTSASIRLAQVCILGCILLVNFNGLYITPSFYAMFGAYLITIIYLERTSSERDDLFYAFGMDGMMVLQTVILILATVI